MAEAKEWGLIYAKTLASPWTFACFVHKYNTRSVRPKVRPRYGRIFYLLISYVIANQLNLLFILGLYFHFE